MRNAEALAGWRPDIPSTARMYDYFLGGKDNYPADREAAEKAIALMPPGVVRGAALQNRRFLIRAVRYLVAEAGIRQFLDIGAGLPTMENVHDVAQAIAPESRIVYVDYDPVVLAHARDLLFHNDRTTIIGHDVREPEQILADPALRALLDLNEPVAVMLVAILHYIRDCEDPAGLVSRLMAAMPSGSYLVLSHSTADSDEQALVAAKIYDKATAPMLLRSRAEVTKLFDGLDLVEPGVVWLSRWHPDSDHPDSDHPDEPGASYLWCGVACKP